MRKEVPHRPLPSAPSARRKKDSSRKEKRKKQQQPRRTQFRERPGIMDGSQKPDYASPGARPHSKMGAKRGELGRKDRRERERERVSESMYSRETESHHLPTHHHQPFPPKLLILEATPADTILTLTDCV